MADKIEREAQHKHTHEYTNANATYSLRIIEYIKSIIYNPPVFNDIYGHMKNTEAQQPRGARRFNVLVLCLV
jgi:hypothetical protein